MISVSVTDESLKGVIAGLKKYGADVKRDTGVEIQKSLLRITDRAKANLTRNRSVRTNRLRLSISWNYYRAKLSGQAYAATKYAEAVERGSRPHVILPKRAKVLRFEKAGKVIFARRVQHPGTHGKPYMIPAADRERPIFNANMKKVLIKHNIK